MKPQLQLSWRHLLLGLLAVASWIIGTKSFGDLSVYYSVSQFAAQGAFDKIYGVPNEVGGFFYSPIAFLVFAPLHFFAKSDARLLWLCLNLGAFFLFWFSMNRLFPFLKTGPWWAFLFVFVIAIKPIHAAFQCHNLQLLFASLIAYAAWLSHRKNPAALLAAGAIPALLGVMKLYPLFLCAFLLLHPKTRVRQGVVAGVIVALLLPLAYFGWSEGVSLYGLFLKNLGHFHDYAPLTKDAVTLSLPSLIATWFSPFFGMPAVMWGITVVGGLISITFFYFVWQNRNRLTQRQEVYLWALALAVMALVNSTTRPDYFIYFVPAFACCVELMFSHRRSLAFYVGLGLAVALIAFISEWILGSRTLNHQLELLRLPVLGMISLCLTLALSLKNHTFFTRAP